MQPLNRYLLHPIFPILIHTPSNNKHGEGRIQSGRDSFMVESNNLESRNGDSTHFFLIVVTYFLGPLIMSDDNPSPRLIQTFIQSASVWMTTKEDYRACEKKGNIGTQSRGKKRKHKRHIKQELWGATRNITHASINTPVPSNPYSPSLLFIHLANVTLSLT